MMSTNALANLCVSFEIQRGGDTGKRGVEHRSFLLLWFTHNMLRKRSVLLKLSERQFNTTFLQKYAIL